MNSNRSLAEQTADALVRAAEAKAIADKLERLTKRVYSQLVISGEGSVAHREHAARCHPKYISIEDEWVSANTVANVAKAEADGLELQFKEWQSRNATNRAEMGLR